VNVNVECVKNRVIREGRVRRHLRHREHFEAVADGGAVVAAVAMVHPMLLASMLKPIECLNYY
jgi:hypothetical protein